MSAIPPNPSSPSAAPPPERFGLAIVAGIVAAPVCALIHYVVSIHVLINNHVIPLLFIGPLIGGIMRVAGRSRDPALGWIALVITLITAVAAFMIADAQIWAPYDLRMSIDRLFKIDSLLFTALSAYLAMLMAVIRS